jgi:hypothetical protein
MSAFTKFNITVSPLVAAGFAPLGAGACAATGPTSDDAVIDSAQTSAIERDSGSPPARSNVRLLVISTAEVQEGPFPIPPAEQRDKARQLRFDARVGARKGLCATLEA